MKFRYLLILLIMIGVIVSIVAFAILDARHILGPLGNPRLEKMEWTTLRFKYFVIKDTNGPRLPRTMELTDANQIDEIKAMIIIKGVTPNSQGVGDESHIVMIDGEVWNVDFVFEDRLDVCKNAERYYSYIYELNDNRMYDRVRLHCLENERKRHPNAVISNIVLRVNLTDKAYEVLGEPAKGDEAQVCEEQ